MGSRLSLAIARIPEEKNTALYFERAARAAGHRVTVIHNPDDVMHAGPLDLFLVVDPWLYGLPDLPRLSCPTVAIMIDVHQGLEIRALFARFFDHVFVAQRDFLERVAANLHKSVHWLPLAGDPGVHFIPNLPRHIDVGFVGNLGTPGTDRHTVLSNVLRRFSTNALDRPYTPSEMGEVYSRSKIVFNKSIAGDLNMRFFEALASGAMLVTDRIDNGLDALATEGTHYVAYDTIEEAITQIELHLTHEHTRSLIAKAGQALLCKQHTYDARLAQILLTVQMAGDARPAPARHVTPSQLRLWRAEWARSRGISLFDAVSLVAEGLSPTGYGNLAIGLARSAKWTLTAFGRG